MQTPHTNTMCNLYLYSVSVSFQQKEFLKQFTWLFKSVEVFFIFTYLLHCMTMICFLGEKEFTVLSLFTD